MRIVAKPIEEEKVLASLLENAQAEEIYEGIISRAECCVVHLCGCSRSF
jgi:hypothetical protein